MRTLIIAFAICATLFVPVILLLIFPRWWVMAISVMAVAHGLVLWATLLPNSQWLGPVMRSFATTSDEVWLTIDDGPTDDTPAMLDALEGRGVHATFFVKGVLVTQRPDLVKMILARGHRVENHSHAHPAGSFWRLLPRALAWQIDTCNAAIEATAGLHSQLFRAPVGMKNPFVHPILARRGMTLVGWSVRGFDSFGDDAARVVRRIVPRVHPGSIIVMHQGRSFSVTCVSSVIAALHAKGYSFIIPETARLKTKR